MFCYFELSMNNRIGYYHLLNGQCIEIALLLHVD